ncbi:MAG: MFS transporter [Eubacteriales bacterium]|nr:MFS transporter [Eubacteriales bacterium]
MKVISKKPQLILYALAGMGVNMLNLMMGSYLCSAIIAQGFTAEAAVNQTFQQTDLVIVAVWAIFGVIAKVLDGIIDVPMASFADNLRTRFGRRRPAILIGMIPMIAAYLLFLVVPNPAQATLLNTIYLGVMLCIFYSFYTLTMVTYYATFTEIVDNTKDRNFLSNVKSFFDIVYFILGYVGVRAMLNGMNISTVALIVLPISLTMIIPLFMIKEGDNRKSAVETVKSISLIESIRYTFRNRTFIIWMVVYAFMTFGVQLFLSGINEYFADTGLNMIIVMMGSFAPVPFTLILYNKLFRSRGFGFAFRYVLICYGLGMLMMFGTSFLPNTIMRTVMAIVSGLVCSLAVGALFSVAYSIPSQLAADEEKKTGVSNSAMYFAVQGLFSGVATAIGSFVVLNALKDVSGKITDPYTFNPMYCLTLICAVGMAISFALTFALPKSLLQLGKETKTDKS